MGNVVPATTVRRIQATVARREWAREHHGKTAATPRLKLAACFYGGEVLGGEGFRVLILKLSELSESVRIVRIRTSARRTNCPRVL